MDKPRRLIIPFIGALFVLFGAVPSTQAGTLTEKLPTVSVNVHDSMFHPGHDPFAPRSLIFSRYPTLPALLYPTGMHVSRELRLRDRLLYFAHDLLKKSWVPYVYGGNRLGDTKSCAACRKCIVARHARPGQRLRRCRACRSCGIDCSHFVNRIYDEAGLSFPYATTRTMTHLTARSLRRRFGLVDMGRDVSVARPGDLLVTRRHVVLLLRLKPHGRGDIAQATRFGGRRRTGGIQMSTDVRLPTFRGGLKRILRHQALVPEKPELETARAASRPSS